MQRSKFVKIKSFELLEDRDDDLIEEFNKLTGSYAPVVRSALRMYFFEKDRVEDKLNEILDRLGNAESSQSAQGNDTQSKPEKKLTGNPFLDSALN